MGSHRVSLARTCEAGETGRGSLNGDLLQGWAACWAQETGSGAVNDSVSVTDLAGATDSGGETARVGSLGWGRGEDWWRGGCPASGREAATPDWAGQTCGQDSDC